MSHSVAEWENIEQSLGAAKSLVRLMSVCRTSNHKNNLYLTQAGGPVPKINKRAEVPLLEISTVTV